MIFMERWMGGSTTLCHCSGLLGVQKQRGECSEDVTLRFSIHVITLGNNTTELLRSQ